jgi:hypothetical protein
LTTHQHQEDFMDINVRLRFDKRTGEVEVVVDGASHLPEAEHNRRHEQVAAEVGRILEQHPRLVEVAGEAPAPAAESEPAATEPAATEHPATAPQPRSQPR